MITGEMVTYIIIIRQREKDSFNIAMTIISEFGHFNIAVDFVIVWEVCSGGPSTFVTPGKFFPLLPLPLSDGIFVDTFGGGYDF